jgi:DNA-binding transcriptional regulator YiaG
MNYQEYCLENEEFPNLFGGEFAAIRKEAGITLQQFANTAGKRSRTTTYNWETVHRMKSWKTLLLMEMVSAPIFLLARKRWRNMHERYVKQWEEYEKKQYGNI